MSITDPVDDVPFARLPTVEELDSGARLAEFERLVDKAAETGVGWLELERADVHLVVVWPNGELQLAIDKATTPTAAPRRPVDSRERLPWTHYAEELREALKQLARQFPPATVADAAAELELLIALHGRTSAGPVSER